MPSNNAAINAQLPAMASAAAAVGGGTDFKAVIVFYAVGGNDSHNWIHPVSAPDYANYSTPRANICLTATEGLTITPQGGYSGPTLRVHPSWTKMRDLFEAGQASFVANMGQLSYPITNAQWNGGSVQVPANLFSHSDQQTASNTLEPNRAGAPTGWGGRMMDLFNPAWNPSRKTSNAITAAGNIQLVAGYDTTQYQVGSTGARTLSTAGFFDPGYSLTAPARLSLLTTARAHKLEQAYINVASRAITTGVDVNAALTAAGNFATVFPSTTAGIQARICCRLIKARADLATRRMVFYIGVGGWDFHSNLKASQAGLLTQIDDAMKAAYDALGEIGMQYRTTLMFYSEFGRCLQQNGDGSDHGWGGHCWILGGNVKGRRVFGTFPAYGIGTANDAGQGRLIPTTATDEVMANVARWMDVPSVAIPAMVPNIGRFANTLDMFDAYPSAPGASTITLGATGTNDQVITGSTVSGATSYRMERRLASGPGAWGSAPGSYVGRTFTGTGLSSSTAYDWREFAANAGGESAASNTVSATTGSGIIIISDNFNRANAASIGTASDGGTWSQILGGSAIDTNRLKFGPTLPGANGRNVSQADCFAEHIGFFDVAGTTPHVFARGDGTFNNCYGMYALVDGSVRLRKLVAGANTDLATSGAGIVTTGADFTQRIVCIGNQIFGFINGVQRVSATDSTFPSNLGVGVRGNGTGIRIDDFSAGPTPPVFTASSPPAGTSGAAYSYSYVAAGAISYAVTAGALPTGLSLNTATGAITGTPSATGTFNFTISATNPAGTTSAGSKSVVIS